MDEGRQRERWLDFVEHYHAEAGLFKSELTVRRVGRFEIYEVGLHYWYKDGESVVIIEEV